MEKSSADKTLLKGSVSLGLSVIVVKILGFVYKVPLSYILGDEGMGYFNCAYTVFSFFYLICSAGIPKAVSIMISECGNVEAQMRRSILVTTLKVFSVAGIACTALIVIFSDYLAAFIGNSGAALTLVFIAPTVLFVSVSGVLRGYLLGVGSFFGVALSGVIEGVVKFVFGLAFAIIASRAERGLYFVSAMTVLGVTLGSFFAMLVMAIAAKIKIKADKPRQKFEIYSSNKRILRRVLKLSLPITIGAALGSLTSLIDLFLIMRRLADMGADAKSATALYGNYTTLAVPMHGLIMALVGPVVSLALPYLARAAREGRLKLGAAYEESSELVLFFVIPSAFVFFLFSEPVLLLLFDDASALTAAPLLSALSGAVIFSALLTVNNTLLESTLHTVAPLLPMLLGAVVKGVSSYLLMGSPSIGILGAPLGTLLGTLASLICSAFLVRGLGGIRPLGIYKLLSHALVTLAALLPARTLYDILLQSVNDALACLISLAAGGILYLLLYAVTFGKKRVKALSLSKYTKIS